MSEINKSPYKGSGQITREQFAFYEMRTTARLMCEGLSDEEIENRIIAETLRLESVEKDMAACNDATTKSVKMIEYLSGQVVQNNQPDLNIEKKDEMSDEDVNSKKIEENKILQENNLEIDKSNENTSNLQDDGNEIENDVKYILDNFELEKPVNGIITSRFGLRTSSNIISANHTGIDIGASEGEKIKSIAKGTVTLVSSLGDYR